MSDRYDRVGVDSTCMFSGAPAVASQSGQHVAGSAIQTLENGGVPPAETVTPPPTVSKPSPVTPSPTLKAGKGKGFTPVGPDTQRMLMQSSKELLESHSQESLDQLALARGLTSTLPDTYHPPPEPAPVPDPPSPPPTQASRVSETPTPTRSEPPAKSPKQKLAKGKGHGTPKKLASGFVSPATLVAGPRPTKANVEPKLEGYWRSLCLNMDVLPDAIQLYSCVCQLCRVRRYLQSDTKGQAKCSKQMLEMGSTPEGRGLASSSAPTCG